MIDAIYILQHGPQEGDIIDVTPGKVNGRVEDGAVAAAQIVQDSD
jgi:hypothetical protein